MNLGEIKDYFENSLNFEKVTGMSSANFVNWRRKGFVPLGSQLFLEDFTNGKLKASIAQEKELFKKSDALTMKLKKIKK